MLTYQLVDGPGDRPAGVFLFLHGILGSGGNWRSFARRLCQARPGVRAVLCDLRLHGGSQDPDAFPPPHSLATAAADLLQLRDALLHSGVGPVRAVLGHSFGGKVALQALQGLAPSLQEAWIIDSSPSARPDARGSEGTLKVLRSLQALQGGLYPRREDFVAALQARGHALPLSQWLAMNLRPAPEGSGYRLGLDLDGVQALLQDYFQRDLWPALSPPPAGVQAHLLAGGRSNVLDQADRDRAASADPRVHLHVLPGAGHDIHVDDPAGLLTLMTQFAVRMAE